VNTNLSIKHRWNEQKRNAVYSARVTTLVFDTLPLAPDLSACCDTFWLNQIPPSAPPMTRWLKIGSFDLEGQEGMLQETRRGRSFCQLWVLSIRSTDSEVQNSESYAWGVKRYG
jgi:hypothetical protein